MDPNISLLGRSQAFTQGLDRRINEADQRYHQALREKSDVEERLPAAESALRIEKAKLEAVKARCGAFHSSTSSTSSSAMTSQIAPPQPRTIPSRTTEPVILSQPPFASSLIEPVQSNEERAFMSSLLEPVQRNEERQNRWAGSYRYPAMMGGGSVTFSLNIVSTSRDGKFSGKICDNTGECAYVQGQFFADFSVQFIKCYPDGRSVHYSGRLYPDGYIRGIWTMPPNLRGTFEMVK